jgi:hypothetical protein
VVSATTNQIVGVLNGTEGNGELIAFAVPVRSLAEFVGKVQPFLAHSLFPSTNKISPVSKDFYPSFVPSPAETLQHRPEEPHEVTVLRKKAQLLVDSMRNFIAVQTFAWGSGDKEPAAQAAYEIRVLDGYQRFRLYPDGKKELQDVPFPGLTTAMKPGDEWAQLPEMVGSKLQLKIHQAPDVLLNEQRIKIFQYYASAEDAVCSWRTVSDFGFFSLKKDVTIACDGEVWTDEDMNILRMSEHYQLPAKWKDYRAVVTYGWIKRADEPPSLIPMTISTQAEYNKRTYWCHGQFTNYQVFTARARIISYNAAD